MTSAVHTAENTEIPVVVRGSIILGVIQSVAVLVVSLINRSLEGTADAALTGVVVAVGVVICAFIPGVWTRARSIDGIATAAGIGLGAALVYMVIDVTLLQNIGTYTNRWWQIGGHSNWWYHPVWWMVSSYLSWLGAFILANQAAKNGEHSLPGAVILTAILAVLVGAVATVTGFPGAGWNVGTFAVAVLPALALGTLVSGLGARRS
jgi:hypothetical protein